jgi:hypothetical protein
LTRPAAIDSAITCRARLNINCIRRERFRQLRTDFAGHKFIREANANNQRKSEPPEHHEICRRHDIRNIPFLAFYRDGSLVGTVTGLQKQEVLKRPTELVAISS